MKYAIIFIFTAASALFNAQDYTWFRLNPYRIAVLNDSVRETSGLAWKDDALLTINDSGNRPDIYKLNAITGKIEETYGTPLKNIDWEAIAADSAFVYIGDFGNNTGSRKDLMIYRIPVDDQGKLRTEQYSAIPFFYPEQHNFEPRNLNTDFDAEAMIIHGGMIHLFTKEWVSKSVSHYILNPERGDNQPAERVEQYDLGYSVSDAAYHNGKLYLVGYTKKAEVFLTVFDEGLPGRFFTGKGKKYYLGSSLSIGQIEGITVNDTGIYLSGEQMLVPLLRVKPYLYFIPFDKLK